MAVTLLRRHILLESHNPPASLLTSSLLAGVVAVSRNITNAAVHVRGAFKVYTEYIRGAFQPTTPSYGCPAEQSEERVLSLLVQQLDLQTVIHSLMKSLDLSQSGANYGAFNRARGADSTDATESNLISLLHGRYSFSNYAASNKYLSRSCIPLDMMMSREIILLSSTSGSQRLVPRVSRLSSLCACNASPP